MATVATHHESATAPASTQHAQHRQHVLLLLLLLLPPPRMPQRHDYNRCNSKALAIKRGNVAEGEPTSV